MANKLIAQKNIKRALEEDPTIFQYDEIYESEIKKDKEVEEPSKKPKTELKPKYISNLLKTAEKRKQEMERRFERKVKAEMDAEGDQFADKPAFITSAYKEKLEERRAAEAKEKYEEALAEAMDVKKQSDLSGFYKYFFKSVTEGKNKNEETEDDKPKDRKVNDKRLEIEVENIKSLDSKSKNVKLPGRISSLRKSEDQKVDNEILGDKDDDIDDDDDNDDSNDENLESGKLEDKKLDGEKLEDAKLESEKLDDGEPEDKRSKEEKLEAIFKKRTVGDVFTEARNRYLERLKSRNINS